MTSHLLGETIVSERPNVIAYAVPYYDNSGDRLSAKYTRDWDGTERVACHMNGSDFVIDSFEDFDWLVEQVKAIRVQARGESQ